MNQNLAFSMYRSRDTTPKRYFVVVLLWYRKECIGITTQRALVKVEYW